MTKQKRKDIYWQAMFEQVAYGHGLWLSLDYCTNTLTTIHQVPEIEEADYAHFIGKPLERLSYAIYLCEQAE